MFSTAWLCRLVRRKSFEHVIIIIHSITTWHSIKLTFLLKKCHMFVNRLRTDYYPKTRSIDKKYCRIRILIKRMILQTFYHFSRRVNIINYTIVFIYYLPKFLSWNKHRKYLAIWCFLYAEKKNAQKFKNVYPDCILGVSILYILFFVWLIDCLFLSYHKNWNRVV